MKTYRITTPDPASIMRQIASYGLFMIAAWAFPCTGHAQDHPATYRAPASEDYGNVLNAGLGIGYFGYLPQPELYVLGNYEFNMGHNFTLAPFLGFSSFRQYDGNPYWNQYYQETVIPVGVKGTYYFDELLDAGKDWDFYAGASLGFVYSHISWSDGNGTYGNLTKPSPLFLTIHVGAEYHINKKIGVYLDLANGLSTAGVAFHRI